MSSPDSAFVGPRIPMTMRSADMLSLVHMQRGPLELANSLPQDAAVIDVGAGYSKLGSFVCFHRPDVTWVNFDLGYPEEHTTVTANPNLSYVRGDAADLAKIYPPESFDRLYSYWVLSQIGLYAPDKTIEAARSMVEIVKVAGQLSVGPSFGRLDVGRFPSKNARAVSMAYDRPKSDEAKSDLAEQIAKNSKMKLFPGLLQKHFYNRRDFTSTPLVALD